MTTAILGGGGAFGINLAFNILKALPNENVIGIGRNPLRPELFSLGIEEFGNGRYSYHAYHVTHELDLLLDKLDYYRPSTIINFAAQGEGAVSWKNSWRFFETNSMALARLVEELNKRTWLDYFIQIGTSELYGSVTLPANEDTPIRPSSPYAASKAAFDLYLLSMGKKLNFKATIVRPCNCYCPGQLLHRIIPKTIVYGLTGRKVPLHGGGHAQKTYMHADDLSAALLGLMQQSGLASAPVYNVGPEEPVSIRRVVMECAAALGLEFDELCEVTEDRFGQDGRYWLDSSAIRADIGWAPSITLTEGIHDMVTWGKNYLSDLRDTSTDYVLRA